MGFDGAARDAAEEAQNETTKRKLLSGLRVQPLPSVMTTPPTIALGVANAASTITNGVTVSPIVGTSTTLDTSIFSYPGGLPYRADWDGTTYGDTYPNNKLVQNVLITPESISAGSIAAEFNYEGLEFELWEKGLSLNTYQIYVDEGYGMQSVFSAPQTGASSGGSMYYRKVTFSSRATRRIRVEYGLTYFGGIVIGPNDTVWPVATQDKIKAAWFGDSNIEGTGATNTFTGFAPLVSQMLGWECFISGVGGTGYLNPGTSPRVKYIDRVDHDCIDMKPDVVVVAGGNNDSPGGYTETQIHDAGVALYSKLKNSLPNAKIIVMGNMVKQNPATAGQTTVRNGLKSAALAIGVPFIDTLAGITYDAKGVALNAATGNWFTGAGNTSAPQATGNASIFVISDNAHCNQAGYRFLADKMVREISRILS